MTKGRHDNILQRAVGLNHRERKGNILFSTEKQRGKIKKGKIYVMQQNLSGSDAEYAAHKRNYTSSVTWHHKAKLDKVMETVQ